MSKKIGLIFALLTLYFVAPKIGGVAPAQAGNQNYELTTATATAFNLIATGPGLLFDIIKSTGAAGEYTVCFDSASITGFSLTADGTPANPRLASVFVTAGNTTTGFPSGTPPIPFNVGLVCANNANEHTNIIYKTTLNF